MRAVVDDRTVADDSLTRLYLRALTPKRAPRGVPATWTTPSISRIGAPAKAEHLRRYRKLCGFSGSESLPITYPHLTAFPMGMALITRRNFPYPVLGLVHVRNEITQLRPIACSEALNYHVWVDKPQQHDKGIAFDIRAEVSDAVGNLVWRSSSTYLRRAHGASSPGPASAVPSAATEGAAQPTWQLPADLGRRYAALTGDRNPIHLYPWTARLFGFRRQIVHGMWSAARCIAALEVPEPQASYTVDFRAPVLLPSAVTFCAEPAEPAAERATTFTLRSASTGRTHLSGRLAPVASS